MINGDFKTNKACEYYCSPSCHPAQIGPDWVYGCSHIAWPQNKAHDFVPIVNCDGNQTKCEIPIKRLKYLINGRKRRLNNLRKKFKDIEDKLNKYKHLMDLLTNRYNK